MKNVVITGSTRGIGLCMAKEFLKIINKVRPPEPIKESSAVAGELKAFFEKNNFRVSKKRCQKILEYHKFYKFPERPFPDPPIPGPPFDY